MSLPDDPQQALARRLRSLRKETWPGRGITQAQLAKALSTEESTSVPLISSWESLSNQTVPPRKRLEAYATFFATERSVANEPFRLLALSELTEHERVHRDGLLRELTSLREAALGRTDNGWFWRFPPDQNVTIVCSDPAPDRLKATPYSDPESPDHVELFRLTDLDALIELWGHIRATNPLSEANFRAVSETDTDDYTANLILLGGVDFNRVTGDVLESLELPVHQVPRETESDTGGFEVILRSGKRKLFKPKLQKVHGRDVLYSDVAHIYRGPNPLNSECTVTICNGMFGRGTLGAARLFTDVKFRDRNEKYIQRRFADGDTFSILTRVMIVNLKVVTPDLTKSHSRLHEWPEASS